MSTKNGYCLQYENEAVTLAEVRPMRHTWRVENLRRTSMTNGPASDMVADLKRSRASLTMMVPNDQTGHAIVSVPALRGKAQQRALAGVLCRDEGGKPNDWCLSWKQFGGAGTGDNSSARNNFLLFRSKEDVQADESRLQGWGLRPSRLLPDFLIMDQFFRHHGPSHAELGAWTLVFVGRKKQFLVVANTEVPLVVRALPEDLSQGRDRGEYILRLATEIDRSVHFAKQTEHSPQIERIVVCGDPDLVGPLVEHLGQESTVATERWEVETLFTWGPHTWEPDDLLTMMGAALNFEAVDFNLLSTAGALQISHENRRRLVVAAVTAGVVILPLLVVGGLITSHVQNDYLVGARQELETALVQAQEAEQVYQAQKLLLAREEQIMRVASDQPDLAKVLLELADLTPAPVVFRSLKVTERTSGSFQLRLEGTSEAATSEQAQAAFLEFLDHLDHCSLVMRRTEPRLLRLKPGEGRNKGRKTTMFRMDLILRWDVGANKETKA